MDCTVADTEQESRMQPSEKKDKNKLSVKPRIYKKHWAGYRPSKGNITGLQH